MCSVPPGFFLRLIQSDSALLNIARLQLVASTMVAITCLVPKPEPIVAN